MAKQLVIVESPTKAKTLERYLGPDYSVTASKGHVRDLPEKSMGVEVDDGFRPEYVVPTRRRTPLRTCARRTRRPRGCGSRPTSTARARRSRGTSPSRSAPTRAPRIG